MKNFMLLLLLLGVNINCWAQNTNDIDLNASLGELHLIGMEKITFVSDQYVFKKAAGGLTIDNAVRINGEVNAKEYFLNGKPLLDGLHFKTQQLNFGSVFQFQSGTLALADFEAYIQYYNKLPRLSGNSANISLLDLNRKLIWQTEELALYILELHKEVKSLRQELAGLKSN